MRCARCWCTASPEAPRLRAHSADVRDVSLSWPDPTPSNDQEQAETAQTHQALGIVSKATLAKRFGYDWEQEKQLIEEEFGDGIMSAIDFDMTMERLPDAKGDRVKIGMSGKFLPFKYYGATGNEQALGYKEE